MIQMPMRNRWFSGLVQRSSADAFAEPCGQAGAVSFGFATVFLGLAFGWIKVGPTSNADFR